MIKKKKMGPPLCPSHGEKCKEPYDEFHKRKKSKEGNEKNIYGCYQKGILKSLSTERENMSKINKEKRKKIADKSA